MVLVEAPRGMATSGEVADAIGSHAVVIRRLLGRLRRAGLVESRSGRNGGWAIAKDPAMIRISDVYRSLSDAAAGGQSPLNELLAAAERAYIERLALVTLADLAEGHTPPTHS